jgi:glutamine synthetase
VAREFNLIACFMSKPFMGVSASGCHHYLSLWRGGDTTIKTFGLESLPGLEGNFTYHQGGENTFMPEDGVSRRIPGQVGLHCIGGVIEHLPALTAIGCSTVNSYRRLWDAGFWAPVYSDWGFQNRTCGLRVSAPGRFEYRAVDSMVNPYLMAAAILKAFDDGLSRQLDPGEPEQRNIYEAMEDGKQVKKLPMSLGEALDCLATDAVIQSALSGEMYRLYDQYKRDEWERFLATTSNWDMENYMDCLP